MKTIHTEVAPAAIGPYSQAIQINGLLFTSGQIPLDPSTMEIVGNSIESQTTQALSNLDAILKAGGSARDGVIKTTVFLKSMKDFARMNEIYANFFGNHKPARSCVEVARLPKDVLFEIECIARILP